MNSSVCSLFDNACFQRTVACLTTLCLSCYLGSAAFAEDDAAAFQKTIRPLLNQYCADCHADGASEGDFTLDALKTSGDAVHNADAWWTVLKNVRSDVMPPDGNEQPTDSEKLRLTRWVSDNVFAKGRHPDDPGPLVLRRLNRTEYRNTIRDLMGVDFNTSVEFPPDDTGDGFDNNSDALSISPLLAEKYVEAAAKIIDEAVPKTSRVMRVQELEASDFETTPRSKSRRLSFDEDGSAIVKFKILTDATYRILVPINVRGSFGFHPAKAKIKVLFDGDVIDEAEYGWKTDFEKEVSIERRLRKGDHTLEFELATVAETDAEEREPIEAGTFVRLQIQPVDIQGPLDVERWDTPDEYERFFPLRDAPTGEVERREYAEQVLRSFCLKAYRHPVDEVHLNHLLEFAGFSITTNSAANPPLTGVTFEQQIAKAMTAVLASPRFLFRIDQPAAGSSDRFPEVDDYSLASRLSYLLWSTMPDAELFKLAEQGKLKANLNQQVQRMLSDEKSERLVKNFVGQWLQTRDVESVTIDPLAALGYRTEYDELTEFLDTLPSGRRTPPADAPAEHHAAKDRYSKLRRMKFLLEADLRRDMGKETEQQFQYVLNNNSSLLELLNADYAFLNQRLAKHYGIPGVTGNDIRKVTLPEGSHRGGILTQGTFLIVTSNPSRTSPVKRGLFILDNILGTPAPPAPAMVPELEEAANEHDAEELTLRQLLELHRKEPLCHSCHARFDPIGLAFENFTAIGTWRDTQNNQPIETSGQLISGESFDNVTALKQVLAGPRKTDFYRCLSERMLAYAIGRSLDFGDDFALEQITADLVDQNGKAQTLVKGVIESAPFLRMRR